MAPKLLASPVGLGCIGLGIPPPTSELLAPLTDAPGPVWLYSDCCCPVLYSEGCCCVVICGCGWLPISRMGLPELAAAGFKTIGAGDMRRTGAPFPIPRTLPITNEPF